MTTAIATSTSISSLSASTPTITNQGRHISGGTIAGIVIGAVFGLVGIAIGIYIFMRKRRARAADISRQGQEHDGATGQQQLQSVKPEQETPPPFELLTTESAQELQRHEVGNEVHRAEMQG